MKRILLVVTAFFLFSGCSVVQQVGGAYNMTQCKYDYNSISNLMLSGMDLSKGISLANIPQITTLLSGKPSSVPLDFTLNLDVTNPNQTAAMLSGLEYILKVDDVQFTSGTINQILNIPAGGQEVLPLTIGFDLATLLTGDSKNAVTNIVKNFVGVGNQESKVTFDIKPAFNIGGRTVSSPVYIPISFSFGGM